MSEVRVYSTMSCPWCKVAKQYLQQRGVAYDDIDVGLDRGAAAEMVKISGQYGVPVVAIAGNVVVGFDQAKIDRFLAEAALV